MRYKKINCPWFVIYALSHVRNWQYSESFAFGSVWLFVHIFAVMEKNCETKTKTFFLFKNAWCENKFVPWDILKLRLIDAKMSKWNRLCHAVIYLSLESECVVIIARKHWWWWKYSFIWVAGCRHLLSFFCNWQSERINYNLSFEKKTARIKITTFISNHTRWMCIIHNGS